jgi:hypothetical protein
LSLVGGVRAVVQEFRRHAFKGNREQWVQLPVKWINEHSTIGHAAQGEGTVHRMAWTPPLGSALDFRHWPENPDLGII